LTDPRDNPGTDWEEALGQALEACGEAETPVFFLEERSDLRVEMSPGHPPSTVHRSWRGLAARGRLGRGPVTYRADPSPDDALHLARLASRPSGRYPRVAQGGGAEEQASRALPEAELNQAISAATRLLLRIHPRAEVAARAVAFEQRIVVARADAQPTSDVRRGARLWLACRLPGGRLAAVSEFVLPRRAAESQRELERTTEALARRAEALVDVREPRSGQLPVVLAPGIGGVLVHEIVGHALEADRVLGGESWLAQFEEPVAHRSLSVIDDPRRGRAPWRIDDEGEASRPTALIRDGRVADWLHDTRTAREVGRATTGHGRCATYRDPIRPRMGCTFVAPGECGPDELLRAVREGVYVRRMESATTDTKTGRAVFRVTDADRIREGRIDAPLRPHLLFVNGARVLAAADRVAADLAFDTCVGSCHRDGQALAISVGAPTMWIGSADLSA